MKNLIVEDEELIADLIQIGLGKVGYECQCAYDGQEIVSVRKIGYRLEPEDYGVG